MKTNVNPMKVSKGVFNYGDSGFLGKNINNSMKNRAFGIQWDKKSLTTQNRARKIKPGVAFSVLTSDINEEIAVSTLPTLNSSSSSYS